MNFINIVLVDRTTHSRICPIVKDSSVEPLLQPTYVLAKRFKIF